jgi:hypothetical protein
MDFAARNLSRNKLIMNILRQSAPGCTFRLNPQNASIFSVSARRVERFYPLAASGFFAGFVPGFGASGFCGSL